MKTFIGRHYVAMKSTRLAAVVHDSLPDTQPRDQLRPRSTHQATRSRFTACHQSDHQSDHKAGRIVHAAGSVDTLIFRTSATARSLEMSAIMTFVHIKTHLCPGGRGRKGTLELPVACAR